MFFYLHSPISIGPWFKVSPLLGHWNIIIWLFVNFGDITILAIIKPVAHQITDHEKSGPAGCTGYP